MQGLGVWGSGSGAQVFGIRGMGFLASWVLGGSWVVIIISGVISPLVNKVTLLMSLLITTHGPPSTPGLGWPLSK